MRIHSVPPRKAVAFVFLAALVACGDADGSNGPGAGTKSTPTADPAPSSHVEAERKSHDFGSVFPASVHRTLFEFQAAGETDLVLRELRYSCDCTSGGLFVVDPTGERSLANFGEGYPPGTRFELEATLNTIGKLGQQHQSLYLLLEDGGRLETFTMQALIEPYLTAEPAVVQLTYLSPVERVEREILLRSRDGEPFAVSLLRWIQGEAEIELLPVEPDEAGRATSWKLVFGVQPSASDVTQRYRFLLATDVENEFADPELENDPKVGRYHRFEYQASLQFEPVVRPWPAQLSFGRVSPERPITRGFSLRSMDATTELGEPVVRLVDANRPEEPYAHAEQIEVTTGRDDGGDWRIDLKVEPTDLEGLFQFGIEARVDHPLQERVYVEARGSAVP